MSHGGSFDVAIIGAGAAAIAAARRLIADGFTVRLLEARDRPGGRAFTAHVAGRRFDAGAAYVHFAERNPWVGIAKSLGIPLGGKRLWGAGVVTQGDKALGESERKELSLARAKLWERIAAHDPAGPDCSLAALMAGDDDRARAAAGRYARQAIGEDPERVGVADLASQWPGLDLTVPGGYGALVARAAEGLPISLETPARELRWGSAGIEVVTDKGALRAQAAIVTVPVGVLAADAIGFHPVLPAATRDAIAAIGMGALSKIALAFDGERFGRPESGDLFDLRSGINFELWPFDQNLVIATYGGDAARTLLAAGLDVAAAEILSVFATIVGPGAHRHCIGARVADWVHDPWSRGAYSVAKPGQIKARLALAEAVADRLWFAGEATAGENEAEASPTLGGTMTVGGATMAGRAAAAAVSRRLKVA